MKKEIYIKQEIYIYKEKNIKNLLKQMRTRYFYKILIIFLGNISRVVPCESDGLVSDGSRVRIHASRIYGS